MYSEASSSSGLDLPTSCTDIPSLLKFLSVEPYKSKVKKTEMLEKALKELDAMIEMQEAKSMIISMVQYYLVVGELSEMNNIDLRGPPGVGKTRLGCIIAKIFNSLGIVKRTDKPASTANTESCNKELFKERQKSYAYKLQLRDAQFQLNSIYKTYDALETEMKKSLRWYNRHGSVLMDELSEKLNEMNDIVYYKKEEDKKDSYIFEVTSRENFVAGYLGQTALKTIELCERCRGGVLFIDEAYSLYHGERDSFGMEALTTLNKFISEHPDEIIVIFGGYKDMLEQTIYAAQPGLKRRVMWTFNIDGYTPEGLSRIFTYQLEKEGWSVDPTIDLEKFFKEHSKRKMFENYGGDTEKLALQCKINYAKTKFMEKAGTNDKMIRINHLKASIDHLKPKVQEEKLHMMYS